jgi:hypothetical protein
MPRLITDYLFKIIGGVVAACSVGGCGPAPPPHSAAPQMPTPPPPRRPDPEPASQTPGNLLPDGVPQRRDLLIGTWEAENGQHTLVFVGDGGKSGTAKYCVPWDARANPIPDFQERRWLVVQEFPYQWETQQVVLLSNSDSVNSNLNGPERGTRMVWVSTDTLRLASIYGDRPTVYRRTEGAEVTEADRRREEQDRYRRLMAVIPDPKRPRPAAPPKPPGTVTVTRGRPDGLMGKVVAVDDAAGCVDRKTMELLPPELWAFNPSDLGTVIRVKRSKEDKDFGEGLIFRQEKWELRLVYAPSGEELATTSITGRIPTGIVHYTKGAPKFADVDPGDVKKYLSELPRHPLLGKRD